MLGMQLEPMSIPVRWVSCSEGSAGDSERFKNERCVSLEKLVVLGKEGQLVLKIGCPCSPQC